MTRRIGKVYLTRLNKQFCYEFPVSYANPINVMMADVFKGRNVGITIKTKIITCHPKIQTDNK